MNIWLSIFAMSCASSYWLPLVFCSVSLAQTTWQNEELPTDKITDRVFERCSWQSEMNNCLQEEVINTVENALSSDDIYLAPGISLERVTRQTPDPKSKSLITSESLYDKFWDNLDSLFSTRAIKINLSQLQEEGRGKKKKKKILKYISVALITAAAVLIPVKLKIIAWASTTAFLFGKFALFLASLVGLKTLISKPQEETTHVHYDGHRSDQAHYLAYGGHDYDLPPGNSIDYTNENKIY